MSPDLLPSLARFFFDAASSTLFFFSAFEFAGTNRSTPFSQTPPPASPPDVPRHHEYVRTPPVHRAAPAEISIHCLQRSCPFSAPCQRSLNIFPIHLRTHWNKRRFSNANRLRQFCAMDTAGRLARIRTSESSASFDRSPCRRARRHRYWTISTITPTSSVFSPDTPMVASSASVQKIKHSSPAGEPNTQTMACLEISIRLAQSAANCEKKNQKGSPPCNQTNKN